MNRKKIIAAGHICIDITPLFEGGKCENVSDLLVPCLLYTSDAADD